MDLQQTGDSGLLGDPDEVDQPVRVLECDARIYGVFEVHDRPHERPLDVETAPSENPSGDFEIPEGGFLVQVAADELGRGAPDRGAIEEAHRRYHLTLIQACDSPWLLRILDLLNSHIIRYWTLSAAPRRNTSEVLEEHNRIQAFVSEGKTDVAVAELTAHLQHALHSVAERMETAP